ncbi:MAG: hypothetical protein M0D55_08975 [Elusimicrobiota bacterium]|nr:MAG: hypothetical protein M0D55_08975 [Elusimicrobiota bacterium]
MNAAAPLPIAAVQLYACGLFLAAWAQMGWVDWKEQKIRNQYLWFWAKLALAGWLALALHSAAGELGWTRVYIVPSYYPALLGHAAFSAAAAYALWWLRIWPAGDVKLFALLALVLPLTRVPAQFRSGTMFLEVLINVFVPAAAFLFLTAGAYLWRTRFSGWSDRAAAWARARTAGLSLPKAKAPSLPSVPAEWLRAPDAARLRAAVEPVREVLLGWYDQYRAEPFMLVKDILSWLAMMATMSLISYYLNDVISSNVLKTLFCFALMFGWSRVCQLIGTVQAMGLLIAALAFMLHRHPNVDVPALAVIFGHITVFSLCIFLGIQIAFRILAGKTGWAFLPVLMMFVGLIPWSMMIGWVWSVFVEGLRSAARLLGTVEAPAVSIPRLPPVPALEAPGVPAWLTALEGSGLGTWAAMGLFFGLALVFVKIWDAESYNSVPVDHIEPFMNLGPSLVERIEADEDFRDEHFPTFYADGLTRDQVEALKVWCRDEGIETVPLAPTISFANWIFLGYFLTRVLDGHVLRSLY